MKDYWVETVAAALDECGLRATEEQIKSIAGAVEVSHENYGLFTGSDYIPDPIEIEAERKLREIKTEIKKREDWENATVPCKDCTTTGLIKDGWGRDVECQNCGGKGRVRR